MSKYNGNVRDFPLSMGERDFPQVCVSFNADYFMPQFINIKWSGASHASYSKAIKQFLTMYDVTHNVTIQ